MAKATPRARVTVGKTLSPGNPIGWTHLAGKCFEAGQHPTCRPVPGAPWRLGTQASAVLLSALCVGKGQSSSRVMECGPERRNHILEILCPVVPQRKGPEGKPPVPRFVSKCATNGCRGLLREPSAQHFAHIAVGSKQGLWEQGIQHGPRLCRSLLGEFGKPVFPLKVGLTVPTSLRIHRLVPRGVLEQSATRRGAGRTGFKGGARLKSQTQNPHGHPSASGKRHSASHQQVC